MRCVLWTLRATVLSKSHVGDRPAPWKGPRVRTLGHCPLRDGVPLALPLSRVICPGVRGTAWCVKGRVKRLWKRLSQGIWPEDWWPEWSLQASTSACLCLCTPKQADKAFLQVGSSDWNMTLRPGLLRPLVAPLKGRETGICGQLGWVAFPASPNPTSGPAHPLDPEGAAFLVPSSRHHLGPGSGFTWH